MGAEERISEDIAMLYLAMLRAAGLTAYAIKVVNRDRALRSHVHELGQLDTTLVVAGTGGKRSARSRRKDVPVPDPELAAF